LFTINLGVYVPEVARHHCGGDAKSWVQEYHCCVRTRLGNISGGHDIWWPARINDDVIEHIYRRLELGGLPFLDRFSTRDKIIAEWRDRLENLSHSYLISPPRIVMAIILAERGESDQAREFLTQQVLETRNNLKHSEYVRRLAWELAVGSLDGC
jgi:hypothetical protein